MTEPSAPEVASQPAPHPAPRPATVEDIMRPPLTTAEQDGHLAGAAYLMKHARTTAVVVVDEASSARPIGLITEADIVRAVADGEDVNEVRIRDVMTLRLTAIAPTTGIRDAAESMITGHFRHLPVVDNARLVGIVDIKDVCSALLDRSAG